MSGSSTTQRQQCKWKMQHCFACSSWQGQNIPAQLNPAQPSPVQTSPAQLCALTRMPFILLFAPTLTPDDPSLRYPVCSCTRLPGGPTHTV